MIAWHHPPDAIWSYTPRQADAFVRLGLARHRAEMGEQLTIVAIGAQSDSKAIAKQLHDWES